MKFHRLGSCDPFLEVSHKCLRNSETPTPPSQSLNPFPCFKRFRQVSTDQTIPIVCHRICQRGCFSLLIQKTEQLVGPRSDHRSPCVLTRNTPQLMSQTFVYVLPHLCVCVRVHSRVYTYKYIHSPTGILIPLFYRKEVDVTSPFYLW